MRNRMTHFLRHVIAGGFLISTVALMGCGEKKEATGATQSKGAATARVSADTVPPEIREQYKNAPQK